MKAVLYIPGLDASLLPDSAIQRDGKPFFIPPTSQHWSYMPAIAWRVARLGKNIAPRFASRYYDAWCPCVITRGDIAGAGALALCHEGALIHGEWRSAESSGPVTFSLGNNLSTLTPDPESAVKAIAEISTYGTLKIGDILITTVGSPVFDLQADTAVTARSDGDTLLRFTIK